MRCYCAVASSTPRCKYLPNEIVDVVIVHQKRSVHTAMTRQLTETHGLNRVPITAPLYTREKSPGFFSRNMEGRCARKKVEVQMKRSTQVRKDWKLSSADCHAGGIRRQTAHPTRTGHDVGGAPSPPPPPPPTRPPQKPRRQPLELGNPCLPCF